MDDNRTSSGRSWFKKKVFAATADAPLNRAMSNEHREAPATTTGAEEEVVDAAEKKKKADAADKKADVRESRWNCSAPSLSD